MASTAVLGHLWTAEAVPSQSSWLATVTVCLYFHYLGLCHALLLPNHYASSRTFSKSLRDGISSTALSFSTYIYDPCYLRGTVSGQQKTFMTIRVDGNMEGKPQIAPSSSAHIWFYLSCPLPPSMRINNRLLFSNVLVVLAPSKGWLSEGQGSCLCPQAPSCSPEHFPCSRKSSGRCSCWWPKNYRSCSVMPGWGKDSHNTLGVGAHWNGSMEKLLLDLDGQMAVLRGSHLLIGIIFPMQQLEANKQKLECSFSLSPLPWALLNSLLPPIPSFCWSSYFGVCKL